MKRFTKSFLAIVTILCLTLTACAPAGMRDLMSGVPDASAPSPESTNVEPAPNAEGAVARAVNDFSWQLFQKALERDGNVMLSPLSVHVALSMAMNGAGGETLTQMRQVLATEGLSQEDLNQGVANWLESLTAEDAPAIWQVANSVWVHRDYQVSNTFLGSLKRFYQADARTLDFMDQEAVSAINGWVKEKTDGNIEKIIDQIADGVCMYLINAVWFHAEWQTPFKSHATLPAGFHTASGTVEATLMHQLASMDVVADDSVQGVVMPYTDPRFVFVALLPNEGATPRQLAAELNPDRLAVLLENRTTTQVELTLPQFESSDEMELSPQLGQLGMPQAFDPNHADFSGMSADSSRDLFISAVRHKTWIRVDEKGTEAGAATSVEMSTASMPMPGVEMRFDRPFLYAVVDVESGMPLFLGVMEDPR